jgi:hypothetical protein
LRELDRFERHRDDQSRGLRDAVAARTCDEPLAAAAGVSHRDLGLEAPIGLPANADARRRGSCQLRSALLEKSADRALCARSVGTTIDHFPVQRERSAALVVCECSRARQRARAEDTGHAAPSGEHQPHA